MYDQLLNFFAVLKSLIVNLTCLQCHYVRCEWKTALYFIANVMKAHYQSSYAVIGLQYLYCYESTDWSK